MQKNTERGKADEQIEKFIEDNWLLLLIIGGIAALYYFRDKLLNYVLTFWESWQQEIIISFLVLAVLLIIRSVFVWWHMKNHYVYTTALPHIADEVDAAEVLQMIRSVHGSGRRPFERLFKGREWFRILFYMDKDRQIRIYLGFPDDCERRVRSAFSTLYPNVEFYPAALEDVPMPSKKAVGGRMVMRRKKEDSTLSLARYHKKDVLPDVLKLEKQSWLDISFSADSGRDLTKGIRKAEKNLRKRKKKNDYGLDPFENEERKSLSKRYSGNETAFRVCVSLASQYYDKQQKNPGVDVIKGVGGAVASVMSDVNEIRFRRWRHAINRIPFPTYGRMTWTGSELANLVHLPDIPENGKTAIVHLQKGQEMLDDGLLSDGIGIGTLYHPVKDDRVVRIEKNQLKKHGVIPGRTGSAKSTVAVSITDFLQQDWIVNDSNEGFTLFDPAADTALLILNRLRKAELDGYSVDWDRVHWVDFRHTDYPPALNLLHRFPGVDIQEIVDNVMDLLEETFPGDAIRTKRFLKNAIGTLLCDKTTEHTMLAVPKLLTDEVFRSRVINNMSGPESNTYRQYWYSEAPDFEQLIDPVLNRLDIFRSSPYFRRMFGQQGFAFDIQKWMEEGHIVLFNLEGMNPSEIQVTVGYIINQYHRIAQKRQPGSHLHMLMIEEAPAVQVSVLPKIIAQDRKFGLALFVIAQSLAGQLNQQLVDALQEVGGNIFACRQGPKSAAAIETMTDQSFQAGYLQRLPDLVAAVSTQDDKENAFCTVSVPPLDRYMPDGKIAVYGNTDMESVANDWTKAKAQELEKKNGKQSRVIDEAIERYLNGEVVGHEEETKEDPAEKPGPDKAKLINGEDLARKDDAAATDETAANQSENPDTTSQNTLLEDEEKNQEMEESAEQEEAPQPVKQGSIFD